MLHDTGPSPQKQNAPGDNRGAEISPDETNLRLAQPATPLQMQPAHGHQTFDLPETSRADYPCNLPTYWSLTSRSDQVGSSLIELGNDIRAMGGGQL